MKMERETRVRKWYLKVERDERRSEREIEVRKWEKKCNRNFKTA